MLPPDSFMMVLAYFKNTLFLNIHSARSNWRPAPHLLPGCFKEPRLQECCGLVPLQCTLDWSMDLGVTKPLKWSFLIPGFSCFRCLSNSSEWSEIIGIGHLLGKQILFCLGIKNYFPQISQNGVNVRERKHSTRVWKRFFWHRLGNKCSIFFV